MNNPRFITEQEMHRLLLRAYRQCPEESVLSRFSQLVSDPAADISDKRINRWHPLLLVAIFFLMATISLLLYLAWSQS